MIHYKQGELYIESVALSEIIEQVPTPFYVYSAAQIEANIAEFKRTARRFLKRFRVLFSVKANLNPHILALMRKKVGAEAFSPWELEICQEFEPLVYTSPYDVRDVLMSWDRPAEPPADYLLRVRPAVMVRKEFRPRQGFTLRQALARPRGRAIGVHFHVGSQIENPRVYDKALDQLWPLIERFDLIDVGGGFPVDYEGNLPPFREFLRPFARLKDKEIWFEPGRFLVGNAGHLVMAVKRRDRALWVDAGLHTFSGVVYYKERHQILPLVQGPGRSKVVYGSSCEGWDRFGVVEDNGSSHLVLKDTGAYGRSLSFMYHGQPLPLEVLVTGRRWRRIQEDR